MIDSARGPYSRIRWFCNDGTVLPPEPYACRDHGGGRQHAEYSPDRERLAELGWQVGTIFAALEPADLADDATRRQRLRELPLERYLIDIDDGWVLRRARNYRGRAQIESEEDTGRALLRALLGDAAWVSGNYLLAKEAVRTIPHVGSVDDVAREVRRTAVEIVALDPEFEALRAEIHGTPSTRTAGRIRTWAGRRPPEIAEQATALAAQLEILYGADGRRDRIERHRDVLTRSPALRPLAEFLQFGPEAAPAARLASLVALAVATRETAENAETTAANRLRLLDLLIDLEAELAATLAEAMAAATAARADQLALARAAVDGAFGTAMLTRTERAVLDAALDRASGDSVSLEDYVGAVDALRRIPQWASGSIRHAFAEPLTRYAALDPRAVTFVDDLIRSSVLVGLGEITRRLAIDVAALTGVDRLIDRQAGASAFGLNTGFARGTLRIFESDQALRAGTYSSDDIVVLPETTPELRPVAGIVTLGEGNPLSHVQLLARNFGIPNIAITADMLTALEPLRDREVVVAVARDGSLVLVPSGDLPIDLLAVLAPAGARRASLRVPPVDLSRTEPIRLGDLGRGLSGRIVGPKAANLGELARLFPGRVAPALALPFGLFEAHVGQSQAGSGSPRSSLVSAYADHRAGAIGDDELAAALAEIRSSIAGITISEASRAALLDAMALEFGEPGTYGVFVRSDTNVEDLPEFTGAGLSETIPNVTGVEATLATIPRVWGSVLSPRAIEWRSNLLENPESVYASVLIMQSVPSTKSGVMVTTNLTTGGPGLTVSAAWGVGGGVGGEATESLVLHADGTETLISSAKSAYQRALDSAGGLGYVPADEGPVLTDAEKSALRALAVEVLARYEPVYDADGRQRPWDIEYGFVDGELTLFQIRPLVERSQSVADRIVAALAEQGTVAGAPGISGFSDSVDLRERVSVRGVSNAAP